jgi:Trypsin
MATLAARACCSIVSETKAAAGVLIAYNVVLTAKHIVPRWREAVTRQYLFGNTPGSTSVDRQVFALAGEVSSLYLFDALDAALCRIGKDRAGRWPTDYNITPLHQTGSPLEQAPCILIGYPELAGSQSRQRVHRNAMIDPALAHLADASSFCARSEGIGPGFSGGACCSEDGTVLYGIITDANTQYAKVLRIGSILASMPAGAFLHNAIRHTV